MPRWKSALIGLALVAAPAATAAQPPAPIVEPSTDRLAAARQLIDLLIPADQRDAMIEQMISSMMSNLVSGIKDGMGVTEVLDHAEIAPVLDRFVARQEASAIGQLKDEMPQLIDAMSRAYARRFTVAQLGEMQRFFETPTGQLYIRESTAIMSDPDVAAWQRNSMAKSMERLPAELEIMKQELEDILGRPLEDEKA